MQTPPATTSPSAAGSAAIEIQNALKTVIKEHGVKQKQLFLLLRYILTGSESGPSISVMVATLGRDRAIARLKKEADFAPK